MSEDATITDARKLIAVMQMQDDMRGGDDRLKRILIALVECVKAAEAELQHITRLNTTLGLDLAEATATIIKQDTVLEAVRRAPRFKRETLAGSADVIVAASIDLALAQTDERKAETE